MSGCQNCKCGAGDTKPVASCPPAPSTVTLDASGKCPCGKSAEECCHKDKISADQNPVDELCAPHDGKEVCC